MKHFNILPGVSRRNFLTQSAGAAVCANALHLPLMSAATRNTAEFLPQTKAKVRLVFTHPKPEVQGWPYQQYDFEGRKKKLLTTLREGCPDVEFLPETIMSAEQARKVMAADSEVDGYVLYLLGIPSAGNEEVAYSGRPVLIIDDIYGGTGTFLRLYPAALAKGLPAAGVSTSDGREICEAVNSFACIKKLSSSTLLDVTDRDLSDRLPPYKEMLGVNFKQIDADELNASWQAADKEEAARWAKIWMDNAENVMEPTVEEITKSAGMYVGMRNLLAKHKAQGITVDCLRLFYGKKMFAYPCLGFFQLNNDGLVGACEADLDSTTTMLMLTYLAGRPGYISDPVFDTSKNEIIYAHCVASNKVYGPGGPANKYNIRDHSEDHHGAAIESFMPTGGVLTTTLKLVPHEKVVVIHQGKAVEHIEDDRACRTKLAAEVPNVRKLMAGWKYGWHRVTAYGDLKVPIENTCRLLGFRIEEEG